MQVLFQLHSWILTNFDILLILVFTFPSSRRCVREQLSHQGERTHPALSSEAPCREGRLSTEEGSKGLDFPNMFSELQGERDLSVIVEKRTLEHEDAVWKQKLCFWCFELKLPTWNKHCSARKVFFSMQNISYFKTTWEHAHLVFFLSVFFLFCYCKGWWNREKEKRKEAWNRIFYFKKIWKKWTQGNSHRGGISFTKIIPQFSSSYECHICC